MTTWPGLTLRAVITPKARVGNFLYLNQEKMYLTAVIYHRVNSK